MEVNYVVKMLSVLIISYLVFNKLLNKNDEDDINISALFVFATIIYEDLI